MQRLNSDLSPKGIKSQNQQSIEVGDTLVHTDTDVKGVTSQVSGEVKTGCGGPSRGSVGHDSNSSFAIKSTTDRSSASIADVNDKVFAPRKLDKDLDLNVNTSSGLEVDLNADYVSNVVDKNPFYPFKIFDDAKSQPPSECGSSTGPIEETESLRKWNAMKQNGFLSSAHGGIPIPKRPIQIKKGKNDVLRRKVELAKKEQASQFAKMAAPSGLLSGLNPGIINHVRNGKQVQSIIEALVRSEKLQSQNKNIQVNKTQTRQERMDINNGDSCPENMLDSELYRPTKILARSRQVSGEPVSFNSSSISSGMEDKGSGLKKDEAERTIRYQPSLASHFASEIEDNSLSLNLSSDRTLASENGSCMSGEEFSANQESINSLSVKAANVASRWLELIQQDIRGRLAALRRSKKRIRVVIQRELPSLMSQQFVQGQESDPHFIQFSDAGCSDYGNLNTHMAKWRSLFNQMDKALSEEGKHLETWLAQVKEMQSHCQRGLQYVNIMGLGLDGLQKAGSFEDSRSMKAEAAVRAHAASIYSTCNLVMATGNVSCF